MIDVASASIAIWHALIDPLRAAPAMGPLLEAASRPEIVAGASMRSVLRVLHVVGLVLGLGGALVIDILLQRYLYRHAVTRSLVETCLAISRLVVTGFAALCVSGIGFVALYAAQAPTLLANPKLAAKVVIVAVLAANGVLVHRIAMARLSGAVGRPLLAGTSLWRALPVLATAAISVTGWCVATVLGMVPELNFAAPGSVFLSATATVAATIFAALVTRHLIAAGPVDEAVHLAQAEEGEATVHHDLTPNPATATSMTRLVLRNSGWLLVLTTAINLTMFAAPLHMLLVYDRVLTSGSVETLVVLTVMCIVLLLSMALLTAARQWLLIGKSEEMERELAPALFRHEADSAVSGRAQSSPLADLAATRQMLTGPVTSALLDLPFAPLFFIGLFALHPYFGLLALAGAGSMIAIVLFGDLLASGITRRAYSASQSAQQITNGLRGNAASAYAMGMTPRLTAIWSSIEFAAVSAQSSAGAQGSLTSNVVKFLRLTLQSGSLALGAWLVLRHETSSGAIIASSIIMGRALAPLEVLIGGWKGLLASLGACRRVSAASAVALADVEGEQRRTRLPAPKGRLHVQGVSHRAPQSETAILEGITLSVGPREVLAVIGEGGSGKSTLARLVAGIERPSIGKVTLDGVDLASWPRADLGPHIGYLAQDVELFDGSVGDNISRFELNVAGPARDAVNRAVIEAAMLCGTHETLAALPKAYDTEIGAGGRRLSASQRKRVALARAVYGDVRLVVLDDPTACLDAAGERALATALQRLREKGCAVVIVTQNANLVQLADKVAILDGGAIVRSGTPQEVFNVHNLHRQAPATSQQQPVLPAVPAAQSVPASVAPGGAAAKDSGVPQQQRAPRILAPVVPQPTAHGPAPVARRAEPSTPVAPAASATPQARQPSPVPLGTAPAHTNAQHTPAQEASARLRSAASEVVEQFRRKRAARLAAGVSKEVSP